MAQEDMQQWLARLRRLANRSTAIHVVILVAIAACCTPIQPAFVFGSDYRCDLEPVNWIGYLVDALALFSWSAVILFTAWMPHLRQTVRCHAAHVLVEGGLLRDAIEYESAEALRPVRGPLDSSAVRTCPAVGKSFRKRLHSLINGYGRGAIAVGQEPLPCGAAKAQRHATILRRLAIGVLIALAILFAMSFVMPVLPFLCAALWGPPAIAMYAGAACTLRSVRVAVRAGVSLAVCDVLGGDSPALRA